jgi:hypothetical protein
MRGGSIVGLALGLALLVAQSLNSWAGTGLSGSMPGQPGAGSWSVAVSICKHFPNHPYCRPPEG